MLRCRVRALFGLGQGRQCDALQDPMGHTRRQAKGSKEINLFKERRKTSRPHSRAATVGVTGLGEGLASQQATLGRAGRGAPGVQAAGSWQGAGQGGPGQQGKAHGCLIRVGEVGGPLNRHAGGSSGM